MAIFSARFWRFQRKYSLKMSSSEIGTPKARSEMFTEEQSTALSEFVASSRAFVDPGSYIMMADAIHPFS